MSSELDELWQQIAGDIEPDCSTLKFKLKDRWVRFHSLPHSKRYPQSNSEMTSIVNRHNEVLADVFLQSEILFVTGISFPNLADSVPQEAGLEYFWRAMVWDPDEIETLCHLNYKRLHWSQGCLDSEIRDAATDSRANIMIVGSESKVIYHPYDGGMDLILSSTEQRNLLKKRFSLYLSNRPEGL